MSTTIFYRRRAERFAQLLDEANGGRRHHVRSAVDDDLAELVAVGHRVSALQRSVDVQVDPEFRVGLRAMLVAAAERESMGGGRRRPGHDRPRGVPGRCPGAAPRPTRNAPPPAHPRRDHRRRRRRRHRRLRHVRGQRERGARRRALRRQAVHRAGPARARQLRPDQGPALPRLRPHPARRGAKLVSDADGFTPGARRHGRQHAAGRPAADHDGRCSARRFGRPGRGRPLRQATSARQSRP